MSGQAPLTADKTRPKVSIGLIPCLAFAVGTMVGGGVSPSPERPLYEAGPATLLCYGIAAVVMLQPAVSLVALAPQAIRGSDSFGRRVESGRHA